MKAFYSKITLYVVRVGRNGEWYDSSPCMQCAKIIKILNIKRIVFTNKNGLLEKHNPQNYNTRFISLGDRAIKEKRVPVSIQHNSEAKVRRLELLAKC
jgi:tRNA(Arg) A34 adenosine deaminase TadA